MPDEIKSFFLDYLTGSVANIIKEQNMKKELERAVQFINENDQDIKHLAEIAKNYRENGPNELFSLWADEIYKKIQDYKEKILNKLNFDNDVKGALEIFKFAFKYKVSFGLFIQKSEIVYDEIKTSFVKSFFICANNIGNTEFIAYSELKKSLVKWTFFIVFVISLKEKHKFC